MYFYNFPKTLIKWLFNLKIFSEVLKRWGCEEYKFWIQEINQWKVANLVSVRNLCSKQCTGVWGTKRMHPREFTREGGGREGGCLGPVASTASVWRASRRLAFLPTHSPSSTSAGVWGCSFHTRQNWDVGTVCRRLRHNLAGNPHLSGERWEDSLLGSQPTKEKTSTCTSSLQGDEFPQNGPSTCPWSKIQIPCVDPVKLPNTLHHEPSAQECHVGEKFPTRETAARARAAPLGGNEDFPESRNFPQSHCIPQRNKKNIAIIKQEQHAICNTRGNSENSNKIVIGNEKHGCQNEKPQRKSARENRNNLTVRRSHKKYAEIKGKQWKTKKSN